MKISNFLIGIVFVGLFASAYGILYWSMGTNYSVTYDNTTLEIYTQQQELTTVINQLNETVNNPSQSSGGFNILGDYLSTGYNAAKATLQSFNIFTRMMTTAIGSFPGLNQYAIIISAAMITIVLIIFFFAVISIFINREL